MSELAEDTRRVTLLLGDNPEGKTQWHTCLDLSHNEYAIQKLRETGRLEAGKATSLNRRTVAEPSHQGTEGRPRVPRHSLPANACEAVSLNGDYRHTSSLKTSTVPSVKALPCIVRSLSRGWTYLSRVSRTDHNWEGIQTDKPDRRR